MPKYFQSVLLTDRSRCKNFQTLYSLCLFLSFPYSLLRFGDFLLLFFSIYRQRYRVQGILLLISIVSRGSLVSLDRLVDRVK